MKRTPAAPAPIQVMVWLVTVCVLVFAMVVVGGVTRLTRSGLSIVDWRPVTGIIPPRSKEQWLAAFLRYQQTPEYREINSGMRLDEFKSIFLREYVHRLSGRLVGAAFAIPFLYFWARRRLDARLARKLALVFCLGGLEGITGWHMVRSGLVSMPHVSHYRLAAHLLLACTILAWVEWIALDLHAARRPARTGAGPPRGVRVLSACVLAGIFVQIASGAFTAGLRAGYGFNTFPLMGSSWIPSGLLSATPAWRNIVENPVAVQFIHRTIAWLLLLLISALCFAARSDVCGPLSGARAGLLLGALLAQFSLGILTLILVVPVPVAVAHQAGAVLLLAAALSLHHSLARPAHSHGPA